MGVGAVLEPLVVVTLLASGVIINRDQTWSVLGARRSSSIKWFAGRVLRMKTVDDEDVYNLESGSRWVVNGGHREGSPRDSKSSDEEVAGSGSWSWKEEASGSLLEDVNGTSQLPRRRERTLRLFGWERTITTPNTEVFRDRAISRLLRRFPFLVEAWYWALIYWVYQVARALGALALTSSTVSTARAHALQVIHTEQALGIFIEPAVQGWFMARPTLMHWTNRIYSFVHIPATILFLIVLYYVTTTRPHSRRLRRMLENSSSGMVPGGRGTSSSPDTPRRSADGRRSPSPFPARSGAGAGAPILGAASPREGDTAATMGSTSRRLTPTLYQRARRTMAMCNLLAFVVFTLWPCMPPRLLSDPDYHGPAKDEATSYGFVDTVHSAAGESSVWTTNRFCNQYAAMPSLHFGYSFLIGLTIASLPISTSRLSTLSSIPSPTPSTHRLQTTVFRRIPSPTRLLRSRRTLLVALGLSYPFVILAAIVATANHFVLDAVAGAIVCGIAWRGQTALLNLLPLEDYFLALVRVHKPAVMGERPVEEES